MLAWRSQHAAAAYQRNESGVAMTVNDGLENKHQAYVAGAEHVWQIIVASVAKMAAFARHGINSKRQQQ